MRQAHWTLSAVTLVLGLAATFVPLRGDRAHAAVKLEDVSVIAVGDSIVVRLATSSRPRYRVDLIDTPYRVVLDLDDTIYAWRKSPLVTTVGPLVQVRGSQYRKDVARVVLELKSRVPYSVREDGDSLLVTLETGSAIATAHVPNGRRPTEIARVAIAQAPPRDPATSTAPGTLMPSVTAPPTIGPPSTPSPGPAGPQALISLEFKDAEVVNLLRILAAESGRNIVIGDDVKGRMSISLHNVPWTLALQTILEARGLERLDRDGVIRIVSVEQLTKEREARAKIEESKVKAEIEIRTKRAEAETKEFEVQQRKRAAEAAVAEAIARGPLTEEAIRLAYADPGEVANTLQGLLAIGQSASDIPPCRTVKQEPGKRTVTIAKGGGGAIEGSVRGPIAEPPFSQLFGPPREEGAGKEPPSSREDVSSKQRAVRAHCATNAIFLRLHLADLQRVRKLIRESLDISSPQVKIEARMEILERDDLFAIGVQWGGGGVLAVDGNRNVIVGRGFTTANPAGSGIPAAGLPPLSNPNATLQQVIPVSAQTGLPSGGNLINLPIGSLLQGAAASGAGGIAFGIIGSRLNLNLALEALRTQGKTVTLARPDIVTLENNLARISLGEEIPFATVSSAGTQIQFKEALLQLTVVPTVVTEPTRNRIRMTVMVENNSRGNVVNLGASGAPPAINRRSAETDVVVNEGDHLVIGGIMTSVQTEEIRKVPMFGDVPILGWLFKQRGTQQIRRELVVFITPTVLKNDAPPGAAPPSGPAR